MTMRTIHKKTTIKILSTNPYVKVTLYTKVKGMVVVKKKMPTTAVALRPVILIIERGKTTTLTIYQMPLKNKTWNLRTISNRLRTKAMTLKVKTTQTKRKATLIKEIWTIAQIRKISNQILKRQSNI